MPELPEVETVMRGLEPVLVGALFETVHVRRANLRFPLPENMAARLEGCVVTKLERRSKYILVHLDDGFILVVHLGMSGRISIETSRLYGSPEKHDHVIFHMSNGHVVSYNDARRFGCMVLVSGNEIGVHKMFRNLGFEPLGGELDPASLSAIACQKNVDLKSLLMDQRIIAGLGNIYVCEALFRAGLSPRRKAVTLARRGGAPGIRSTRLVSAIQTVLRDAIKAGGSTLRDHRMTDGSLGYFQHSFKVYGREGGQCSRPGCAGEIKRIRQAGRSTFYCGHCQS